MPYSLTILWFERNRFFPAILAVSFSALLIALQCGMLLGFLSVSARPIRGASADVWIGSENMPAIGFSEPIPETWRGRIASEPEVTRTEPYVFGVGVWRRPQGGTVSCYVIGSRLEEGSLGASNRLEPEIRSKLTVPGAIAVDESALAPLGLTKGVGELAEVFDQRVHVVGVLHGAGTGLIPGMFCSLRTAKLLLPGNRPNQTTFLLARCQDSGQAETLAKRLQKRFPSMATLTQAEFVSRTAWYWLTTTKAGLALGFAALLGFVVGAVITSQTLYAAVISSLREYAVLRALGIPGSRIRRLVMAQSFWIGLFGMSLALPVAMGVAWLASRVNIEIDLSPLLLGMTAALTLLMGEVSGLWAIRSIRQADPVTLLR